MNGGQNSHGFHHRRHAVCVIGGTSRRMPGIQMRADEDDLVPQHRIGAGYLSKDVVAVEIVLVGSGPDLDTQLWCSSGLHILTSIL